MLKRLFRKFFPKIEVVSELPNNLYDVDYNNERFIVSYYIDGNGDRVWVYASSGRFVEETFSDYLEGLIPYKNINFLSEKEELSIIAKAYSDFFDDDTLSEEQELENLLKEAEKHKAKEASQLIVEFGKEAKMDDGVLQDLAKSLSNEPSKELKEEVSKLTEKDKDSTVGSFVTEKKKRKPRTKKVSEG